jgi:anionic cell wall polymer biosynthesis LytR-Cps2A-Psr (LCP) family protein
MPGSKSKKPSKVYALSDLIGEIRNYIKTNGIKQAVRRYGDEALNVVEKDMIPFRADHDQRLKIIEAKRKKQKLDDVKGAATIIGTGVGSAKLIAELKKQKEEESSSKSKPPVNKARGGMVTKWENKWG